MKNLLILIFTFGIAASALPKVLQKSDERVIGATKSAISGQFPWVAGVMLNRIFICGGALISDLWVLTSAEYVYPYIPAGPFSVELANLGTVSSSSTNYPVFIAITHPGFVPGTLMHHRNIALLKLTTAVPLGFLINPISLPAIDQIPIGDHTDVQLTGWGLLYNMTSPTLEYVDLQTMTIDSCIDIIGGNPSIEHDYNVCTAAYSSSSGLPSGACERDEGSALVWQYSMKPLMVGVVSISDCMAPASRKPTIYTSTFGHNREWISIVSGV